MPVYVIVAQQTSTDTPTIQAHFPDVYAIAPNAWVVKTDFGTQEISDLLFPKGSHQVPSHVVFRIDAYWGHHDKALWEWLSKDS